MLLSAALAVWIGLAAALCWFLPQKSRATVPITATAIALILGAMGAASLIGSKGLASPNAYHDTYYVIGHFHYLLSLSLGYLVVGLLAGVIRKSPQGLHQNLTAAAFWVFHAGMGASLAPTLLARYIMPRRYVDYPSFLHRMSFFSSAGSLLAFLGLAGLLFCALTALILTLLRRRS